MVELGFVGICGCFASCGPASCACLWKVYEVLFSFCSLEELKLRRIYGDTLGVAVHSLREKCVSLISLFSSSVCFQDTEVLDNTVYRDRVNLGRKRGHRAPATRSGGALSENDGDNWMFRDSTGSMEHCILGLACSLHWCIPNTCY